MMKTFFCRMLGQPAQAVDRRNMENRMVESSRNDAGINKVVLDEKYFRRMEKFDGEQKAFRNLKFNLEVAIGQVDQGLAKEIKK
eukprot:4740439-Karenia_brevis.AAC.1